MSTHNQIELARDAILQDLALRYKQGDKSVLPLRPENEHRWHKPQDNYFAGNGEINCPVCPGRLQYHRSALNGHVGASCSTQGCVHWQE